MTSHVSLRSLTGVTPINQLFQHGCVTDFRANFLTCWISGFAAAADMKHHRERAPPCGESQEVQGHPHDADDGCHDHLMTLLPLVTDITAILVVFTVKIIPILFVL